MAPDDARGFRDSRLVGLNFCDLSPDNFLIILDPQIWLIGRLPLFVASSPPSISLANQTLAPVSSGARVLRVVFMTIRTMSLSSFTASIVGDPVDQFEMSYFYTSTDAT
jgi:hypothetical protein